MTAQRRETTYVSMSIAIRRTGLSHQVMQECMSRRLVLEPLTAADLTELRRIRRLQELGVNLSGIEIILHMRRRMEALQAELSRWEQMWGHFEWTEPEEAPSSASFAPWQRLLPAEPD